MTQMYYFATPGTLRHAILSPAAPGGSLGPQRACQPKSSSLESGCSLVRSRAGAAVSIIRLNSMSNSSWDAAISRSVRWGSSVSQYTIIVCPIGVLWSHTFSSVIPRFLRDSSYAFRNSPEPETISLIRLITSSCPGRIGRANATDAISATPFSLCPQDSLAQSLSFCPFGAFRFQVNFEVLDAVFSTLLFRKI